MDVYLSFCGMYSQVQAIESLMLPFFLLFTMLMVLACTLHLQMDSSHLDQAEKSSPEISSDSSISQDSPDTSGIFGEPLLHPRVGDEYQVEIPPLLAESELLRLMVNPVDYEGMNDSSLSFLTGLAVPVMCIYSQPIQVRDERIEYINHFHAPLRNELLESVNIAMRKASSLQKEPTVKVDAHGKTSPTVKVDAHGKTSTSDLYYIVPGRATDSWSEFEADCFLLGLYIFGKNLLQVSRFMDGKNMGQILSFYYGRFYGSPAYCKWSECRKMRNRKCVLGHRFFTGYRQQELYSRLIPHLSDESRTKLLEAARAFAEGRTTLDEYVSTLKALVGIHVLVEAVGIGKGKDDLTTLIIDSTKNNQMFTHRPEIPSGKACSSLSCAEIVKYLTGDFRLSKARSNDLFWEAVWPRLLARGWHSEQPRGDGYAGSKNSLVFLMPGIKKFSRRKLNKGDHYFDSVSDVLAKVASEPELLELEVDETGPTIGKEENGWAVEVNADDDDDDRDPSDHERHCYLKPRVSTGLSNLTKFTVVDTSLANDDNPCKVRELRSLPLEAKRSSTLSHRLRKSEIESQGITAILPNNVEISTSAHAKGVTNDVGESQRTHINNVDPPKMPVNVNLSADHKSRAIKHQFSRRGKSGPSNCSGQVPKRRKLASCVETDVTYVLSLPAGDRKAAFRAMSRNSVPPKVNQPYVKVPPTEAAMASASNENLKVDQPYVKVPPTEAAVASASNEKVLKESLNENCVNFDIFQGKVKKLEAQEVIDLNLPQVPTEPEIDDDKVKVEEGQHEVKQHSDVLKSIDSAQGFCILKSNDSTHGFGVLKSKDSTHSSVLKSNDTTQAPHVLKSNDTTQGLDVLKSNDSAQGFDALKLNDSTQGSESDKPKCSDANLASEPKMTSATNKDSGSDQLPRRQSTRNRPLTTKALEALEIGFLNPVRHSRKRSPSTSQDQKPKRSRQARCKSALLPNIIVIKDRGVDGIHNEKTDVVGNPHIGSIPAKNEVAASNPLGVSEVSCSEAP